MSNTELQNLQSVLRHSLNDDASVYRALVSYLKSSDDTINYNLIGGAMPDWNAVSDQLQCAKGAPAHAADCVSLISKCLKGEPECINEFDSLKEAFINGLVFQQGDVESVKNLLKKLGINTSSSKPVEEWLVKISKANGPVANSIKNNDKLIAILNNFVVKVRNPTSHTGSAEHVRAVAQLTNKFSNIPFKKGLQGRKPSRLSEIPMKRTRTCLSKKQTGGGLSNVPNTFVRLMDAVDTVTTMSGGGEAKSLYQPLSETYNSLVDTLKYQGKKIEDSDDAHIRNLLSELNVTEEKLLKTAEIIKNFNKATENPETAKLLGGSQVPNKTMADVYKRYEELEIRQAGGAKNIKSILQTIYNALQGKDSNGNNVAPTNVEKNLYNALKGANSY